MKKSEAIEKLSEIVCDENKTTVDVMDFIEEVLGMTPPNDGKKRYIKPSSVPCVVEALKCHQWEEEDEEK
tara:strand:- start:77 stop:286 length:210 start_codon:yes stop_codon:yes gene_type:complete